MGADKSESFFGSPSAITEGSMIAFPTARAAAREVIRRLGITEASTPEEKRAAKLILQQLGLATDTGKSYIRTTQSRNDMSRQDYERPGLAEA